MRFFRLLLGLYPPSFRRRFEAGMVEAYGRELEDARKRGSAAAAGLRLRTWTHLLLGAPGEWWAELRRGDGDPLFRSVLSDARRAMRSFLAHPGFTWVVVLTLALGIGANTAIFSVVDTVLLRPLPYAEPEDLAFVWGRMSETSVARAPLSGPDLMDIRDRSELFRSFAAVFSANSTLSGEYGAERIRLGNVTTNVFDVLGVEPILGRGFTPDDSPDISPSVFNDPLVTPPPTVAVLGYELWRRRYGGDEDVIGRSVRVNGQAVTIVGVAPPGFRLYLPADASIPGDVDLWTPVATRLDAGPRDAQWLVVMGRKRSGATWEQAQAELDAISARLREEHRFHANVGTELAVAPMHGDVVDHVRPVLLALVGAVGFVLLIACANVANLLLVRAGSRDREIAIRRALGGGRGRIVRQMLTESAVLALAGGLVGVGLALGAVELLEVLRPEHLPRAAQVSLDGRVLGLTVGVSFLAAFLFGTVPALQATRFDLSSVLADRGGTGTRAGHRLRDGLVVVEVALSLVLLIGAGLLLRSFFSLRDVDPGFEAANVLTVNVVPPAFKYQSEPRRLQFFRSVKERLDEIPGVEAVGGVAPLPLSGGGQLWFGPYALTESEEEWSRNEGDYRVLVPGYFEAVGVELLRGRTLTEADSEEDAEPVVVVDETLARSAWPGEEAVGQRILVMRPVLEGEAFAFERYWARVVGMVEHVRYDDLRSDSRETIYFPLRGWSFAEIAFTLRTVGDPAAWTEEAREAVIGVDPDVAPTAVRPFAEYLADATAQVRFGLTLVAVFAGIALLLATVGLYGVISFAVAQRTREIGVRMAFGAGEGQIAKLIVGRGALLALGGVALGIGGALLLTRSLSSLLYGVEPTDPVTFAALALFLTAVAVAASWIPARRAARVDPVDALGAE